MRASVSPSTLFRKGEPGQSQACEGEKEGRDRLVFVPLQRLKEEESRKGARDGDLNDKRKALEIARERVQH
jgi:hypothetical protein